MQTDGNIKQMVREKYGRIALQDKEANETSCCGATSSCSGPEVYTIMADDYTALGGYHPDADLGLGCGLPTQFAKIERGDVVIDLGSGAGNDAFVALAETGPAGKVIGIDFTEAMIDKARRNAKARGAVNVEFILGDIEDMPLPAGLADVVISNCVLNLLPNKENVLRQIYRVLKPGGHFSISDIVLEGNLPQEIVEAAEMYAGCVAGAIQKAAYLELIEVCGFKPVVVQKDKAVVIPDSILSPYLSADGISAFRRSGTGIRSITVYAEKPVSVPCCANGCEAV